MILTYIHKFFDSPHSWRSDNEQTSSRSKLKDIIQKYSSKTMKNKDRQPSQIEKGKEDVIINEMGSLEKQQQKGISKKKNSEFK